MEQVFASQIKGNAVFMQIISVKSSNKKVYKYRTRTHQEWIYGYSNHILSLDEAVYFAAYAVIRAMETNK